MSDAYFSSDLFSEFERLQRQMSSLFPSFASSIRASRFATFPPLNIGTTEDSVEIVAFAPGVGASAFDISIDKGLLTISGERKPSQDSIGEEGRVYAQERFTGSFRRVVELPESADPDKVQARYENGCLMISIGKRESSQPRVVAIQ